MSGLILAIIVLAAGRLAPGPARALPAHPHQDPGAWLAKQLGVQYEGRALAAGARQLTGTGAPQHQANNIESLGAYLIDNHRKMFADTKANELGRALALSSTLISQLEQRVQATKNQELSLALASIYFDRIQQLNAHRMLIEACIESQALKNYCESHACSEFPANEFVATCLGKVRQAKPLEVLGLAADANLGAARRAFMKYVPMLHPDKNRNLDEESRQYRQQLFVLVKAAFDKIKNRTY